MKAIDDEIEKFLQEYGKEVKKMKEKRFKCLVSSRTDWLDKSNED